jgi:hypothetical protein
MMERGERREERGERREEERHQTTQSSTVVTLYIQYLV